MIIFDSWVTLTTWKSKQEYCNFRLKDLSRYGCKKVPCSIPRLCGPKGFSPTLILQGARVEVYRKDQSCLYFLRLLRSFKFGWTMLRMFIECGEWCLLVVWWGTESTRSRRPAMLWSRRWTLTLFCSPKPGLLWTFPSTRFTQCQFQKLIQP